MAKEPTTVETAFDLYMLGRVIGEGGAGRVYAARSRDGADVAVKVLSPDRATAKRRKRFENEINFGQRAQHRHVMQVLASGVLLTESGTTPFYVMPKMAMSLREHLPKLKTGTDRLKAFDQILSGVDAAHRLGVVHRDLKPENILLATSGEIVVADFGIASFQDEELYTAVESGAAERLANFQYAAPEQRVRGRPVDARADIYALGMLLNEMFTGELPLGTGYRSVAQADTQFGWIDGLVEEMLRNTSADRPASIDVIKQRLQSYGAAFVERQRLDAISKQVVPVGDEMDPLALQPLTIVDFDWRNGTLRLTLSSAVNQQWVSALSNMGGYTSAYGAEPGRFSFRDNAATVRVPGDDVQRVIDHFKEWLPKVQWRYAQDRQRERQQVVTAETARLAAERAELEKRAKVRQSVKL